MKINTADGMLHPVKIESEKPFAPKKMFGDTPEMIQRCLNCTAEYCDGRNACPMMSGIVTGEEIEFFRAWLIENVVKITEINGKKTRASSYKQVNAETHIAITTLRGLTKGANPRRNVQAKIRAWIDKQGKTESEGNDGNERVNVGVADDAESL